ncbi:hypothetical protein [Symbioplanes lichenis]|nr:hypothetical protein [Actinoplanes lichenis]
MPSSNRPPSSLRGVVAGLQNIVSHADHPESDKVRSQLDEADSDESLGRQ